MKSVIVCLVCHRIKDQSDVVQLQRAIFDLISRDEIQASRTIWNQDECFVNYLTNRCSPAACINKFDIFKWKCDLQSVFFSMATYDHH